MDEPASKLPKGFEFAGETEGSKTYIHKGALIPFPDLSGGIPLATFAYAYDDVVYQVVLMIEYPFPSFSSDARKGFQNLKKLITRSQQKEPSEETENEAIWFIGGPNEEDFMELWQAVLDGEIDEDSLDKRLQEPAIGIGLWWGTPSTPSRGTCVEYVLTVSYKDLSVTPPGKFGQPSW